MGFCTNCGKELPEGTKFCPECGTPTEQKDMSKRKQEYGGKIVKCPNCGEILNSFETKCSSCGYNLRGAGSTSSVKELEMEIKKIESNRNNEVKDGLAKSLARVFNVNSVDPIDNKIANMISSFAIPNAQEDVFEFMILAASNIDPTAYDTTTDGYAQGERDGKLMISNAWESKYNQALQKAKIMFPNDPRLVEIENLYKTKKREVRSSKYKTIKIAIWAVLILVAMAIFAVIMSIYDENKEKRLENELNNTVIEIQTDISNGDYDDALIKANGLRFDEDLDSKKAKQWDDQRENLIKLINDKKGGN